MRLSLLIAGLISAAAVAQNPTDEEIASDVVVVGNRDRDRQLREFVDALSEAPPTSPIARFDGSSVCPTVVGLSKPQNAAIAARMRQVAAAAGLRVATTGCEPNVLVIVARDKKQVIEWLRKKRPGYFRDATNRYVAVPDLPGPVTAWQLQGLVDRSGLLVPTTTGGVPVVNATGTATRMSAAARPIFLASIMVLEIHSLTGLTTTQIADYAAMRAFSPTDPARLAVSGAPTILTILDAPKGSPLPITLTNWDLGYLRALYASAKYRYAPQQRTEIRRQIERDLQREQSGEE